MPDIQADIAIVGAGMAGASLAAFVGDRARVVLLEAESQPGYHATGRSAAFWTESYGGPAVQPLTTASGPWLQEAGVFRERGCVHLSRRPEELDAVRRTLENGGIGHHALDRTALLAAIPGLRAEYRTGIMEPSCCDIDVAALHQRFLSDAKAAGAQLLCDAAVSAARREGGRWHLETGGGAIEAAVVVNAAGAWAKQIGALVGALAIGIQPYRRTMLQLVIAPEPSADLPLVMDAAGQFYFKPAAGGRLWLSPHDETPVAPHDVAPEEWDQAVAIARLAEVVDWQVVRRERAWSGLRSFAPDRAPVYGFDPVAPGLFWFAGQGGFGIQTAPAAAMLGAALLLGEAPPVPVADLDPAPFAPNRFI